MSKTIGAKGLALVKKWEGCYLNAYKDVVGVWTIGWGTTKYPNGAKVKAGDKITQAEADAMLKRQVQEHANGMTNYINTDILNQNQYDALASFHYNLGRHILKNSYLLSYLKAKNWSKATGSMLQYNKGRINGVLTHIKGLQNRRNAEVELFNTPVKVTTVSKPVDKKATATPPKRVKTTSYKVTADMLNIRKSANATSKILGTLKKGNYVQVIEIKNGWAKLKSNDNRVYVNASYIKKV